METASTISMDINQVIRCWRKYQISWNLPFLRRNCIFAETSKIYNFQVKLQSPIEKQFVKSDRASWYYLFNGYLTLFMSIQSVYRSSHSTETVLHKMFKDVYENVEAKSLSMLQLVALNISSAFDTICHAKLLATRLWDRPCYSYGSHHTWGTEVSL